MASSPRLCSAARSRPKLDHQVVLPTAPPPPGRHGEPAHLAHRREHVPGRTVEQSRDPIRRAAAASRSSAIIATMRRFRPSPTVSALSAYVFRRNELRAGGGPPQPGRQTRSEAAAVRRLILRTSATAMTGPGGRVPMCGDHPDLERITGATITASGPRRLSADLVHGLMAACCPARIDPWRDRPPRSAQGQPREPPS
jgi:hypothetical protein